MREADGLLIGSPVYFASLNGTLLSLFPQELMANWEKAQKGEQLDKIEPLK